METRKFKRILPGRLDLFSRLHLLVRDFPRYNRFTYRAYETTLTLSESHLLTELDSDPALRAAELARLLGVSKSVISGLQQGLIEKGLLQVTTDSVDARQRRLRLTQAASRLLRTLDAQSEAFLKQFCDLAELSEADLKSLAGFVEVMADGLGAAPTIRRSEEHILCPQVRRLTRAFRLLGQDAMGSDLSSLQWQVLLEMDRRLHLPELKSIARSFHVPWPTLAQALSVLTGRGLVQKTKSPDDARAVEGKVTKAGKSLVRRIQRQQVENLSKALESLNDSELEHGLSLVERFMLGASLHYHVYQQGFSVEPLCGEEIQKLRLLQLETWRTDPPDALPGTLYSEPSSCWIFRQGDAIQGGCELSISGGAIEVLNLCAQPEARHMAPYFLALVLRHHRSAECVRVSEDLRKALFEQFEPFPSVTTRIVVR